MELNASSRKWQWSARKQFCIRPKFPKKSEVERIGDNVCSQMVFVCAYLLLLPERGAGGVHVPEGGGVVEAGVRAHHDADDAGDGGRVQLGGRGDEARQVAAARLVLGRELRENAVTTFHSNCMSTNWVEISNPFRYT